MSQQGGHTRIRRGWAPMVACAAGITFAGVSAHEPCMASETRHTQPIVLYVAVNGNDAWSGRPAAASADGSDGPFATLARARDEIRKLKRAGALPEGGAVVVMRGGDYVVERTLVFDRSGSGTANRPIVYRAAKNGRVRLTGGRLIDPKAFTQVRDTDVLARLPAESRTKVLRADLKALGITDYGIITMRGFPQPIVPAALELFFNSKPMTLARWPNSGFVKTGKIIDPGSIPRNGDEGNRPGAFVYDGNRPDRWSRASDVWLFGYWCWDWADETIQVAKIDAQKRQITLAAPHHYGLKQGQRYYAMNLLEEIDQPGEWYLDRKTGMLYFWPPGPIDKAEIAVSMLETPILSLRDASHIRFEGLTFEYTRGTAVQVIGGTSNRITDSTFHNIGNVGIIFGQGATAKNTVGLLGCSVFSRAYQDTVWDRNAGTRHRVERCTLSNLGEGGIILGGGDRITLTPGRNAVVGCTIHNYSRSVTTNRPAVWMDGVGNRVAHNHVYDAPHTGIMFWGNDHVIEYNELHDVCKETGDVGVIYTGRDWTMRGTLLRWNYIHDVHGPGHGGAQGIYLDDCASGSICIGNVLVNVARAFLIGGGRDNIVENNLIVDCGESVSLDGRGIGWMERHVDDQGIMRKRLCAVPYQSAPWRNRYPELVGIMKQEPGSPRGNVLRRNVILRSGPMRIHDHAIKYGTVGGNLETRDDIGFADAGGHDYRLRCDSLVFKELPDFEPIPFERIGAVGCTHTAPPRLIPSYPDERRQRWEKSIAAFEAKDTKAFPPTGVILFVGSSSIRGWDVGKSFPKLKTINRGFGGSQFVDATHYADRIIIPYRPSTIVVYDGDNDIAGGKDAKRVLADCRALIQRIQHDLPDARIILLSIKVSESRWRHRDEMLAANALMRELARRDPRVIFLDANTPLLGADGRPRAELYRKDRLHLNSQGYAVWASLLEPLLVSNGTLE